MADGDLIPDLMAQIISLGVLLLQRLISARLFLIQRLTGFLCEIRRLSVSSSCGLLLSFLKHSDPLGDFILLLLFSLRWRMKWMPSWLSYTPATSG
jgi:hypothetical protein